MWKYLKNTNQYGFIFGSMVVNFLIPISTILMEPLFVIVTNLMQKERTLDIWS